MERELALNNGLALPDIAFGTWQIPDGTVWRTSAASATIRTR